jgi:hypothetical protein
MIKSKTFRPWLPGQTDLMPASPIEWLPSDHLVFFLLDFLISNKAPQAPGGSANQLLR